MRFHVKTENGQMVSHISQNVAKSIPNLTSQLCSNSLPGVCLTGVIKDYPSIYGQQAGLSKCECICSTSFSKSGYTSISRYCISSNFNPGVATIIFSLNQR